MSSNITDSPEGGALARWVPEREAAEILRLAPGTLRQWRHHRRGPAFHKVGRAVRYDRAELHRFVLAGRVEMTCAA